MKLAKRPLFTVIVFLLLVICAGGCGRQKVGGVGEQNLVIGAGRDFYEGPQSPGFAHNRPPPTICSSTTKSHLLTICACGRR